MDLSRRLRSTALIIFIFGICIQQTHSRFFGTRPKRQYGAQLYLPESSVIPGGEGADPREWSDWSSPSQCSRSCGGGVSFQARECLRPAPDGSPMCSGGNRKYFSCNTQDCPEQEEDFRAQQCSHYNHVPFEGTYHEWVPYMKGPNPCELNCMPKGMRFYYRQKVKVADGTRCNDRDLDVCVDGQCYPVGCDMMLGSNANEDKCRKCGGDGSTCNTIEDTYKTSNLAAGYNDIFIIPSGATNIRIEETEPSNNYLAVRNLTGHYHLNGNWRIDFPRAMFYAGGWWTYQRQPTGFLAPDQLTCSGPITETVYIVVLVQDKNVSVDYEYSIPDTVSQNAPVQYGWTHMEFEPCSASCGGGTQSRVIKCNNRLTLEEVDPSLCDQSSKPAEGQECGTEPCAPHWVEGEWGKCSKGCGEDGMQDRTISCERISPTGEHTVETDDVCLQQVGNKPATTKECNREKKNCPQYHLGPWTPCDKLCGEGKQTRKVTCYIKENGRKKVLAEEECVEEKPETEKKCVLAPCEGVDWIISQWSGCEACGQTTETRTAFCGSKAGEKYADEFCAPEVPLLSRPCQSKKCETQWFTSEWSKCSAPCGKGTQSRIVLCGEYDGKKITSVVDDSKCDAAKKPEAEQECEGAEKECPGEWFAGPWEECSKPCGGGEQAREVLCLANGTKSLNCDEAKIESLTQECNTQACTQDEVIPVDSTAKPIEEDDDDDECSEEEEDGDVEVVTDKMSEDLKISDGIDLDEESTTLSSLITDELMLSDAPSSDETVQTDSPFTTVEGSGDSDSTDESSLATEGSGDSSDETTVASSDVSESSGSTDAVGSTDASGATEASSATDGSDSTGSDVTEATSSGVTESGATEESGATDVSGVTDESGATDISESTDASGATDGSDVTESTIDVSTVSGETEASASTEAAGSDDTDATSGVSDTSASSNTDDTSDATTEEVSSDTTDSSSTEPTDTTTDSSSDSTTIDTTEVSPTGESSTESASDTTEMVSESTADESTESGSEATTEGGTSDADSTDTTGSPVTGESTESVTDQTGSDETTVSGSDETTVSGSDETTVSGSDETTISGSDETTVSGSDETTVSGSEETTVSGSDETTVSGLTDTTGSAASDVTDLTTESATGPSSESPSTDESTSSGGSTEEPLSTASGATEESTETSVTGEEQTTVDIWASTDGSGDDMEGSTPNTLEDIVTKETKSKCKAKPKKDCKGSAFGCCPDKKTKAKGPFDKGCPIVKTCAETKHGCCSDGVSPAEGKNNKGCPKSQCAETLFGCCPDKYTPAEGEDNEGCPEPTTVPPTTTEALPEPEETDAPGVVKSCAFNEFGCCPDGTTPAKGEAFAGCDDKPEAPESPTSKPASPTGPACASAEHGCCNDGRTPAAGPNKQGCESCTSEPFGCCPDQRTPAHGPLGEGCCLNTQFGCCPDNINAARGPNFQDCDCQYTPYGCCPDKKTAARGSNNDGCGCETTPHGCCPDKLTPASGPKFEGCACHTMQFGCCADGVTFAEGPHHYGCHCGQTEFKCCPDGTTPAKGPEQEGCTCVESKFGCCPDGVTAAQDEKFLGCENVHEAPQKACGLPKETGSCGNYSIKYFFDTSYGACARFWYGGCEGNDNRFQSEGECKQTCQEYTGKDVCLLPKSEGPCTGYSKKWYFNSDRGRCEEFNYGGCYGTNNRFDTLEACQSQCAVSDSLPSCDQPMDVGPCNGQFERWYYENETDVCRPFRYGGCKGNKNNFASEDACSYQCRQPGVHKEHCSLPKQPGDCSEQHPRWYYSEGERRCAPFYYTGCGGNKNNFPSQDSCEDHCPKEVAKDVCEMAAEVGECTNFESSWYYDTKAEGCRQFYYGGCGGNENRFASEDACSQRCQKPPEPEPEPEPQPQPQTPSGDVCSAKPDVGDCSNYVLLWHFDQERADCGQFYYGGCGGNDNRFASREECLQRCSTPPPPSQPEQRPPPQQRPEQQPRSDEDACSAPQSVGDCDQWALKWHYNSSESRCAQFYYGGCGGNANRFETEEDCLQRCSSPQPPVEPERAPAPAESRPRPDDAAPVPPAEGEKCFLQPEHGDCGGNETRWYYNSGEGICDVFEYGGCGGNANNYPTEDECQNQCFEVQTTCSLPPLPGRCDQRMERWYFDERTHRCAQFEFTGCRGNRNNFISETECREYCDHSGPEPPAPPAPQPAQPPMCELPAEAGECDNTTTAWYYDAESLACTAFTYSGCGGNDNRFATKEQCDRQCGEFRGIDVCNEPVAAGPCRQWQTNFYFNRDSRACEPFTYGGCEGTANRFTTRGECESVCIVGYEPTPETQDICKLPVTTGQCNGPSQQERRYYYDDERGACVPFVYSGCSGNQNNFHTYEACYTRCSQPIDSNEIPNELEPGKCEPAEEECRQMRCPFGIRRQQPQSTGECVRCTCENPCEGFRCAEGEQCAVEVTSSTTQQFEPVCRPSTKPGQCPRLVTNSSNCVRECNSDADCRADYKCCSDGCGHMCVRPSVPTIHTTRPTTAAPVVIYPGESRAALEPKTPQELAVRTATGGIAVLRCFATGNPAPNVTWSRQNVMIDTNQGRYVLTSSGDLTIVQVRQTDSGSYVCIASNGLGEPVRREMELEVQEPVELPAYVLGPANVTQLVVLNRAARIRCPAGGYPKPHVSWWRNRKQLGTSSDRYEMHPDYSLMFNSIRLTDLGLYECEVYNTIGRPSTVRITLKAVGPARAMNHEESQYLQYVLPQPVVVVPVIVRPSYPYYPTRRLPVPPPSVDFERQQPRLVSAQAILSLDPSNTYAPGSRIILNCIVQGYPAPAVTWSKNAVPVLSDGHLVVNSNPHQLIIEGATGEDSGDYTCTAKNAASYSSSTEKVNIESPFPAAVIPVHPDCVDNPHYANCKVIVEGKYCNHHFYKEFCCRSCMLAGAFGPQHPNVV